MPLAALINDAPAAVAINGWVDQRHLPRSRCAGSCRCCPAGIRESISPLPAATHLRRHQPKGFSLDRARYSGGACCTGPIFGVIKAHHPSFGWLLKLFSATAAADWGPGVAFVLLVLLGHHMIHSSLRRICNRNQEKPDQHCSGLVTALATSIVRWRWASAGADDSTSPRANLHI